MAFTQSYIGKARVMSATTGVNAGLLATGALAQILGETLQIVGTTSLSTVTTGVNTGTAGAGTSATSLAKPAAAANWTAANLVGKWLQVTSGGGAPTDGSLVLRPILANTTTTLSVNTITGLDATSVFQIVDLSTQVDQISGSDLKGIRAAGIVGPLEIYGFDFSSAHSLDSLIALADCTNVKISGCKFAISTAGHSVLIERCIKVAVEHCSLSSSADILVRDGCQNVSVTGCVNSGGGVIAVQDCNKVDVTKLSATSAPSRVLSMTRVFSGTAEVAASSGGATPVYLEAVQNFYVVGGTLTGTGNTGYGLQIAFSGQYNLTGSTITGTTNDVLFDGNACAWANELGTTYGRVATQTMGAVAQTVPTKTIIYGNQLFNGSGDHSSRELFYGIINPAQNTGLTAAGTNAATALQLPAGEHYGLGTVAAGTGVKLHNVSALPGPRCVIDNNGANACLVYPTSGTINGAASYSLAAGAIKMFVCTDFSTDKWKVL